MAGLSGCLATTLNGAEKRALLRTLACPRGGAVFVDAAVTDSNIVMGGKTLFSRNSAESGGAIGDRSLIIGERSTFAAHVLINGTTTFSDNVSNTNGGAIALGTSFQLTFGSGAKTYLLRGTLRGHWEVRCTFQV